MTDSQKPERLTGTVSRKLVRQGTASEHNAVVLNCDSGEQLVLQRIDGNPFSDPVTQRLTGKRVSVVGYRLGDIFRYTKAATRK
jgi:hypothetical protein